MEPASAFALACGVIQVIDFGQKLLLTARRLYKNGSLQQNEELKDQVSRMQDLRSALSSMRPQRTDTTSQQDHVELLRLAETCDETVEEILKEIDNSSVSGSPKAWDALKKSLVLLRRGSVIEKLKQKLDGYQKILDTRVLVSLRKTLNSLSLEQKQRFESLDKSIQNLAFVVAKESTSSDSLAKVINDEGLLTRQHMDRLFQRLFHHLDLREDDIKFRQGLLNSLYFPEIACRQEEIKDAHKDTFHWIFETPHPGGTPWSNFSNWLRNGSQIYWINGKAGSGKSTLMNYVLQNHQTREILSTWAAETTLLTPSFFFWAAGGSLQKSVEGFLRSLIFQILDSQPALLPLVAREQNTHASNDRSFPVWTERRLRHFLSGVISEISESYRIRFFIDGLDEFQGDRDPLIELVLQITRHKNVKCCISSRPETPFGVFKSYSTLRLQDLTRKDIRKYVKAHLCELAQLQELRQNSFQMESLIEIILEKADGVFLWVELAVKSQILGIKNDDSLETLYERLYLLPTQVEGLYSGMLKRIDKVYLEEAAWYLRVTSNLLSNNTPTHPDHQSIFTLTLVKYGLTDSLHLKNDFSSCDIDKRCAYVNSRIGISCATFLEAVDMDEWIYPPGYDEWLAWEPAENREKDTGIDWTKKKIQFFHRTAKDFFEPGQEGGNFLDQYAPSPRRSGLLEPATVLVKMQLCNLTDPHLYMRYHACRLMRSARFLDGEDEDSLEVCVALMRHFDEVISNMDRVFNRPLDGSHWCRRWVPHPFTFNGRTIQNKEFVPPGCKEFELTDLISTAAFFDISWFVKCELQSRHIETNRATYLAACALTRFIHPYDVVHMNESACGWRFSGNQEDADMLMHLIRMGANPNTGFETSIWEQVLHDMYKHKLQFREASLDHNLWPSDMKFAEMIKAFIQGGADPKQVISLSFLRLGLHLHTPCVVQFDIDTLSLPLYPNNVENETLFGGMQKSHAADQGDALKRPSGLRILFETGYISRTEYREENDDDEDEKVRPDSLIWIPLSIEQVQEMNKILRTLLDISLRPTVERSEYENRFHCWAAQVYQDWCSRPGGSVMANEI